MNRKTAKILAGIIGVTVLIFHIIWGYNFYTYYKYTDGLDSLGRLNSFSLLENGYVYHIKCPDYLSFTGNFAVSTSDSKHVLIIWPSLWDETEYGVQITGKDEIFVSIKINRSLDAEYEQDQSIIDENSFEIETLFQKGEEKFLIDFK